MQQAEIILTVDRTLLFTLEEDTYIPTPAFADLGAAYCDRIPLVHTVPLPPVKGAGQLCRQCGEWMPLEAFRLPADTDCRVMECPPCEKASAAERRYGMHREDLADLLAEQGYACAICGTDDPGHKNGWAIDHCHECGNDDDGRIIGNPASVRGYLCPACNTMLGIVEKQLAEGLLTRIAGPIAEYLGDHECSWDWQEYEHAPSETIDATAPAQRDPSLTLGELFPECFRPGTGYYPGKVGGYGYRVGR